MIPTAQFDPASLAIWSTTGNLAEPHASMARSAMRAAAKGENPSTALNELSSGDKMQARLRWLASCIWHEKRHFLDTCLTNYGARRFRDLFHLAANFLPLAAYAKRQSQPMWFPVEIYGCPVRRHILGIPEPPSNILESARIAKEMKLFASQLDQPVQYGGQLVHLGGEAQLEGLAQVSQINSIEHCFGIKHAVSITSQHVHGLSRLGPYRMIETVSGVLGCSKEVRRGTTVINANLASALFLTALCGRYFGVGSLPPRELVDPWSRLARMIEHLGAGRGSYETTEVEAFDLVDKAARRLWGRTALEEIADDIDAMEAKSPSLPSWLDDGLITAFAEFIKLRRQILRAAQNMGAASLLPRSFPTVWRDRLQPWHVVATPGGDFRKDDDSLVVCGRNLSVPAGLEMIVPAQVIWAKLYEPAEASNGTTFSPANRKAWLQMLEINGPRALLMLNGRRHRRMVPPELDRVITEVEELGIRVRFDSRFEWPEQRSNSVRVSEAIALAAFSGRDRFVCDLTGDEIEPEAAAVLTPWEFRNSPLYSRFQEGNINAQVHMITDWSDWVVRRDLLE